VTAAPALFVMAGVMHVTYPDTITATPVPASTHQAHIGVGGITLALTRPALEALDEAIHSIRLCAGCTANVAVGEWEDAWWCEECWPDDDPEPTYRGK
jgi:hypothetical protein